MYQLDQISFSRIAAYSGGFGCPAKFKFGYVLGLKARMKGTSLSIGWGVGHVIAMPTRGRERLTVWRGEWEDYCHKGWDDIDPEQDREAMLEKGRDMLAQAAIQLPRISADEMPEYYTERTICDPDTGEELPPFVGYLDWYTPKTRVITELKTSSRLSPPNNHLMQLALYSHVMSEPDTPVSLTLIQISRAKVPKIRIDDVTITSNQERWILRSVADTVHAINANIFPARPSFMCNSCEFRAACQDGDFSGLVEKG